MAQQKDITKHLESATQLEQELQISYAQKGVAVLDIYSSEWGHCKAISETFRRLYTEASDNVHLRFFAVESNAVLESLKNPSEEAVRHQQHSRPKNTDAIRDTLPESWKPILDARQGQSKPYFIFYKEGRRAQVFVEGVDTPRIKAVVKDLCTVKTPASEFITHPKLQELWDENFNPEESEVPWDKFVKALTAVCKLTVPLNDEERAIFWEAIYMKDKERVVQAEGLQKWIGDDETRTIMQAFTETLPDYEERAIQARIEKEAEEKRNAEEVERQRQEDEKQAEENARKLAEEEASRKKEEDEAKEAAAKSADPEERLRTLNVEIEEIQQSLKEVYGDEFDDEDACIEGDYELGIREYCDTTVSSKTLTALNSFSEEAATQNAKALLEAFGKADSSVKELETGFKASKKGLAAARDALKKDGSLTGFAHIMVRLLGSNDEESKKLLGGDEALTHETLYKEAQSPTGKLNASLAVSLLASATPGNSAVVYGVVTGDQVAPFEGAEANSKLYLPSFTMLTTNREHARSSLGDGDMLVTLSGAPELIFGEQDGVCFTNWVWACTVEEAGEPSEGVAKEKKLKYDSAVQDDDYRTAAANFHGTVKKEDEVLQKIVLVGRKAAERKKVRIEVEKKKSEEESRKELRRQEAPAEDSLVEAKKEDDAPPTNSLVSLDEAPRRKADSPPAQSDAPPQQADDSLTERRGAPPRRGDAARLSKVDAQPSKDEAPPASKDEAPPASKDEAPAASKDEAPPASKDEAPPASKDEAPVASKALRKDEADRPPSSEALKAEEPEDELLAEAPADDAAPGAAV